MKASVIHRPAGLSLFLLLLFASLIGYAKASPMILHITVDDGFEGYIQIVSGKRFVSPNGQKFLIKQSGSEIEVPDSFLDGTTSWDVAEVKTASGKVLPIDKKAPRGVLAFRGYALIDGKHLFLVSSKEG